MGYFDGCERSRRKGPGNEIISAEGEGVNKQNIGV